MIFCIWRFAALIGVVVCLASTLLFAEDVKLREEAVHLMERANAVSLPGTVPNYEQVVTFRVHYPDGTTKEGSYSRVMAGALRHRDEVTFGDQHSVIVRVGDRQSEATKGAGWSNPPEFRELLDQLPVHLGRFDHEDVISSIEDTTVQGRPAKCIQFGTHFGDVLQSNQVCVDAERGVMLHWQVGDETIENSDYFQVDTLWEPAHIVRNLRGALRMEIDQKISMMEGPVDPNVFTPPNSTWKKLYTCRTTRRPIGISTQQPPSGNQGSETVDVIVTGLILETGKTFLLQVRDSTRPDLNAEALATVGQWTFQPMMCDDRKAGLEADFVVHFQGR
jgi:hypothetical protein